MKKYLIYNKTLGSYYRPGNPGKIPFTETFSLEQDPWCNSTYTQECLIDNKEEAKEVLKTAKLSNHTLQLLEVEVPDEIKDE
jgi:hypothetical protein